MHGYRRYRKFPVYPLNLHNIYTVIPYQIYGPKTNHYLIPTDRYIIKPYASIMCVRVCVRAYLYII